MLKRSFAMILITVLICTMGIPAFGEGNYSVDFQLEKDKFEIGKYIEGEGVVKKDGKGKSGADVALTVEDNSGKSVYEVDQMCTDGSGNFDFSFKLPNESKEGVYIVKIKAYDIEKEVNFELYKSEDEIEDSKLSSISIESDKKQIKKGETLKLSIKGKMTDGKDAPNSLLSNVKWTSSNTKVATVTSKGVVTGKSKGTATITAKIRSIKDTIKITVNEKEDKDPGGGGPSGSHGSSDDDSEKILASETVKILRVVIK